MIIFAGICSAKFVRNVLRGPKNALQYFFGAHEARYDFEFSLANASESIRRVSAWSSPRE